MIRMYTIPVGSFYTSSTNANFSFRRTFTFFIFIFKFSKFTHGPIPLSGNSLTTFKIIIRNLPSKNYVGSRLIILKFTHVQPFYNFKKIDMCRNIVVKNEKKNMLRWYGRHLQL